MVSQQQINDWKAKHGDILHVPFDDGKSCYLTIPTRKILGLAYAKGAKDPLGSAEVIVKNCWLGGDPEIQTEAGYLIGISEVTQELSDAKAVEVHLTSTGFLFDFEDGLMCEIKTPDRNQASLAMMAGRRDPMAMVESILQSCWMSGDERIKTGTGYLITLVQKVDEILAVKTAQVKKI